MSQSEPRTTDEVISDIVQREVTSRTRSIHQSIIAYEDEIRERIPDFPRFANELTAAVGLLLITEAANSGLASKNAEHMVDTLARQHRYLQAEGLKSIVKMLEGLTEWLDEPARYLDARNKRTVEYAVELAVHGRQAGRMDPEVLREKATELFG